MLRRTRRWTLHMGMASLAAAGSAPTPSPAIEPVSPDAELVRLCSLWQSIDEEFAALCDTRVTIDIDARTQAKSDSLLDRQLEIEGALAACLPPKTIEGATVIANLALTTAQKWNGNYRGLPDVCHQMAWDALAFFYRADSKTRLYPGASVVDPARGTITGLCG